MTALRQAKEQQAVPACSGDLAGDGAQRSVAAGGIFETLRKYFDHNMAVGEPAGQKAPGFRDSPIALRLRAIENHRRTGGLSQETDRSPAAQVSISNNFEGLAT